MAFSLTWLPTVSLDAGLKVDEQPGWRTRGRADVGTIKGVICHHTAGPKTGIMPSLGVVTNGRSDLPGPLSQLCLGRDGTFFVMAAGRANHAGAANWQGVRPATAALSASRRRTPARPPVRTPTRGRPSSWMRTAEASRRFSRRSKRTPSCAAGTRNTRCRWGESPIRRSTWTICACRLLPSWLEARRSRP